MDAIVTVELDTHTTIAPTLPIPKLTMILCGLLVGLRRAEQCDNLLLAHTRSNNGKSVERYTMRRHVGGQRRPARSASNEDCCENHELMSSVPCHTAPCLRSNENKMSDSECFRSSLHRVVRCVIGPSRRSGAAAQRISRRNGCSWKAGATHSDDARRLAGLSIVRRWLHRWGSM